MRHRLPALVLLAMSVILFVIALIMGIRTFAGPSEAGTADTAPAPAEAGEQADTAEATATPVPTQAPWPGPMTPEQSVKVGREYFEDAAFLGSSVLSGLMIYDYDDVLPPEDGHWFGADGLTVMQAVPYAEQMSGLDFGKIYVGFGNNEMSYDQSTLRQAYALLLDKLEADHPDAVIYLVSATPVSLWKSSNSSSFTREYCQSFNSMLKDICRDRQVWYQDAYSVLCNEEGYLPSDVTNDGIHFTPAHYELWFDYMQTHYIPTGPVVSAASTMEPGEEAPAEGGGT